MLTKLVRKTIVYIFVERLIALKSIKLRICYGHNDH